MRSLRNKLEARPGKREDIVASESLREPARLTRALLLLVTATAAIPLSSGAIFFEGGQALAVFAIPAVVYLILGSREALRWMQHR